MLMRTELKDLYYPYYFIYYEVWLENEGLRAARIGTCCRQGVIPSLYWMLKIILSWCIVRWVDIRPAYFTYERLGFESWWLAHV
jgi:hypothetical protein